MPTKPTPRWCSLTFLATAGGVAVMLILLSWFLLDRPVAWWSHETAPSWWRSTMNDITRWGEATLWVVLLAGLCGLALLGLWLNACPSLLARLPGLVQRLARHSWGSLLGWASLALAAVVAGGGLVNLFKVILGRHRPRYLFVYDHMGFEWFSIGYLYNSFPSGHSATAGALMAVLILRWPGGRWLWLVLGLTLMFSRAMVTAHYVSDVVAGGYLGFAITCLLWHVWRDRGWIDQKL